MDKITGCIKKSANKFGKIKKKQYLCTRNSEINILEGFK